MKKSKISTTIYSFTIITDKIFLDKNYTIFIYKKSYLFVPYISQS